MLPLIIVSSLLVNWIFLSQDVYAAPLASSAQGGHLTFAQYASEGQQDPAPHGAFVRPAPEKPKKLPHPQVTTLPGAEPATMKLITQVLASTQTDATMVGASGIKPLDFLSSDGRFEVQVPSGAFDLTSAQNSQGVAPSGALTLQISQLQGHSMGLENLLGSYQIQVLDSQNTPLKKLALRTPITVIYHYQPWEMQALDLNPDQIFLSWPGLLTADKQAKTSTANDVVRFTNDTKAHTLTAQTTVLDMKANLSVGSEPNNQSAPTPHFASVQGNSGNLSYSYPLQIAPGTAGFEPDLQLTYSSGSANARHSQVAPADDAGDGWSVSLGAITASQQLTPNGTGAETVYSISGVDHVSDRLIPDPSNAGFFLTEHISHLRINQVNNGTTGQICFHVYDPSGTYYEFGCTTDSLQYYTTAAGRTNYAWDLNTEGSPFQGPNTPSESINASYLQDLATVGGYTSVRDAALEQVKYGKENSTTGYTAAGTVDFHYHAPTASSGSDGLHQPWAVAYGTNYHCSATPPASTTLRCDNPIANGSSAAPATMSTLTLDSIASFVGDDSAANHLDYAYALAYNQDTPFTSCNDPETNVALYCAGEHTLASITPSAYLGGTAHAQQPTVFTYTAPVANSYVDSSEKNQVGQTFSGQSSWDYLISLDNEQTGVGETIKYGTAWNNTHGTPAQSNGDNRYEPLYCGLYGGCTGSFANPNDQAWTVQVVTQIQNWGTDSSSSKFAPAITNYDYSLTDVGTSCPSDGSITDCVGYEWYPSGDTNWINYYDAEFRGFASVYITSPAGDLTVDNYASTEGLNTPATDAENYLTGTLKDEEVYRGNSSGGPLLQETKNTYAGDDNGGSAGSCDGGITAGEYAVCENVLLYHTVHTYDSTTNNVWAEQDFYYDDYDLTNGLSVGTGHYHNMTEEDITYSNAPETRQLWTYSPNDQVAGGFAYYDVNKVTLSRIYDASNHIWGCTYTNYDEGVASGVPTPAGGWPTRVQTYSSANCGSEGNTLLTRTYTGYDGYGNVVASVDGVGTNNASVYASAGCTPATQPTIMTPYFGETRYTSCTNYDSMSVQATSQANALGQTSSTVYDTTQQDLPTSATDANNQTATASYSYDGSGNPTLTTKQPLETNSYSGQSSEASHCTTSSVLPCFEMDTHTSTYSSAITRTFYDQQGRAVEARTPGPTPGDDTVAMTVYNDQLHTIWKSIAFEVTDGTGWIDPNGATDINGHAPAGTVTFYDALGRVLAVQDPNYGSTQEPGISCSTTLSGTYTACTNYTLGSITSTGDNNLYERVISVDPNKHATLSYSNALGEVIYGLEDSGVYGGTLTLRQLTTTQYNALGKPTSITVTDKQPQSGQSVTSVTTTMTYDDLGRMLTTTDPDQGTFTASYDADSRVTSVVQTSGSNTRTTGSNYDLLGRVGCVQTAAPTFNTTGACTAGNPLLVNTYDITKLGTQGTTDFPVGRLTQSVATTYYPDSSSATVTQQYQTDQRGRATNTHMQLGLPSSWNVTTSLPSYQLAASYNDANQVTTTSATAGAATYSFTPVYDSTNGSLQGLSSGSIATANLASLAYNEYAQLSGITLLNGSSTQVASEQYSYDGDQRPTSLTTNWLPGSGTSGEILGSTRTYDNASNVTSLNTFFATVPGQSASGGSEAQNFCYDEQNRLIWAGNGGTQPGAGNGTCGSGTLSSGLVGGGYTSPTTYTNLGQIWQGPVNGHGATEQYLYCNSAPHQLTGIYPTGTTCANKGSATAVYTAGYDAWGNETSRTYNSTTATLSYDTLNRMTEYNAGANSQEFYLYDGSGNRVLKRSISGGSTKLTAYAFGLQELSYTGSGAYSSQTDYYSIAGHLIGSTNGTTTTYDLTDAEGSVLTSLSSSAVLGEQIYGPYGNQRYTQGTMGTDKGYTGQFQDAVSGFDYYNARYYDPVMGQFLSADNVQGNAQGRDPYAYVGDNPETETDPTGQRISCPPDCDTSGGIPTAIHPGGSSPSPSPRPTPVSAPVGTGCRISLCSSHPKPVSKPTFSSPSKSSSSRHTSSALTNTGTHLASGDQCVKDPSCEAGNEALAAQSDISGMAGAFDDKAGQLNVWGILADISLMLIPLGLALNEASHLFQEVAKAADTVASLFGTMSGMTPDWWTSKTNVMAEFNRVQEAEDNAMGDINNIADWWNNGGEAGFDQTGNDHQDPITSLVYGVVSWAINDKNELSNRVDTAEQNIENIMLPVWDPGGF